MLATETQDSEERLAALIPESASDLKKFQTVVGKAWETIVGRRLDQVGEIQFNDTKDVSRGEFLLTVGHLKHDAASEQIPVMRLKGAKGMQKGVVAWITETGKAGLLKNDEVIPPVAKLLKEGYLVVSADLSGQGEFLVNDQPLTSQRMWQQRDGKQTWHRFAGYTYGYNHSLFVKRAHDVLSLIKFASTLSGNKNVYLVGLDRTAGPIALAARSQADDSVAATIVDLDGFQFQQIAKHDDPMFVSGAVKYLDVAGLLSVCSPHRVSVSSLQNSVVAKKVFAAADASKNLNIVDRSDLKDIADLLQSPN